MKTLAEIETLLVDNSKEIEEMSFDHDLGENEPTGYDIAKWLAENCLERWPLVVKVHSQNPVGAENIRNFDGFVRRRLLV